MRMGKNKKEIDRDVIDSFDMLGIRNKRKPVKSLHGRLPSLVRIREVSKNRVHLTLPGFQYEENYKGSESKVKQFSEDVAYADRKVLLDLAHMRIKGVEYDNLDAIYKARLLKVDQCYGKEGKDIYEAYLVLKREIIALLGENVEVRLEIERMYIHMHQEKNEYSFRPLIIMNPDDIPKVISVIREWFKALGSSMRRKTLLRRKILRSYIRRPCQVEVSY